ncbi:hypothetical protein MPTK2_7g04060 [Marchantia polymorpha subsp. ruderalis]
MGKALRREVRESIWRQLLVALDEADNVVKLDQRLWAKFRVSYDRLGSREKEIFLLAASFFNNSTWTLGQAKSCWRVVYGFEDLLWQKLVDMSIVYDVGEEEIIQMQEQLRSLGTKLASESGTCGKCRTWTKKNVPSRFNSSNYNERMAEEQFYSSDSLHRSSSTGMKTHIEEVMALRLEDSMSLTWRDICQMKKLRYLDSEKELRLDEKGGKLPTNLVLLRWRGEVNNLHDLIDRGSARHLAVLDLKAPLTCLPTTVCEFRNLEVLKLHGGLFQGLPETFVQLPSLHHLTFSYCRRLRSLPEAFGRLSLLRFLELRFCHKLEALPSSTGQLPRLQTLIIEGMNKLQRVPTYKIFTKPTRVLCTCGTIHICKICPRCLIADLHLLYQLSDSVYELHKPGVESMLDDDDDILFHGLQSSHTSVAHLSTWRSRGLQMEVWPKACRRKYGLFQGLPETFVQLPSLHHLKFSYCRRLRDLIDRGSARHLAARDLKAPLTCLPTTVSLFRDLEDLILHGGLFQGSAMHWAVLDLKAWLTCLFRDLEDLKLHGGCEPNLPTLQRL